MDIKKSEIQKMAEQYAEEQNSCCTNDYYGFIAGFEKALNMFAASGSVCDHKDSYIVSGVFGGKWCENCKEMVDNQSED